MSAIRVRLFLNAVLAAIAKHRAGYLMTKDEAVTATWRLIEDIAGRVAPSLNFSFGGAKPARSVWPYFRQANGLVGAKGVVLVWKAERGQVDLQFADTSQSELARRCGSLLDATMQVVPASKSACVRIAVSDIDFRADPITLETKIVEALAACERLRAFFVERRERLLRTAV